MFGLHRHREQRPSTPTHDAHVDEAVVDGPIGGGPIPEVARAASGAIDGGGTASERAYDGKDPYKDKKWANRGFDQLTGDQRALVDSVAPGHGEAVWARLSPARRAGFLNITAVMVANGFSLAGLALLPLTGDPKTDGIQQDRLLFTAGSATLLRGPLDHAIANRDQLGDRGFTKDKPEDGLHPGMSEWGGRQWVTRFSMQIGGGSGGAFVDIDEYGPKVDVVGTIGHGFEVLRNKLGHHKTDPFDVARGLHKRGDDP